MDMVDLPRFFTHKQTKRLTQMVASGG